MLNFLLPTLQVLSKQEQKLYMHTLCCHTSIIECKKLGNLGSPHVKKQETNYMFVQETNYAHILQLLNARNWEIICEKQETNYRPWKVVLFENQFQD